MVTRINPYERIKDDPLAKRDRANCCVVALMKVMDCSYKKAYEWCRMKGYRRYGQGMLLADIDKMFTAMSNTPNVKGPYGREKGERITINQFIKKHPKGRFFCVHRGHAFAIIDGVLYDHTDKPRRQIYYARRVYPPHLNNQNKAPNMC